ncbi:MAG: endolytic transglycosylase MltG [Bacteroidales bacterium]|jgi:UPF0755 protein|nr:endolytic transglycosylase MltG [Bacteroidales bacterium]MDX9798944.1 endolytic transglycosylase MltG [Bacteroidales bacterium]
MNYFRKNIGWIIPVLIVIGFIVLFTSYFFSAKVDVLGEKTYIYVYPNSTKKDVLEIIQKEGIVFNTFVFKAYSTLLRYEEIHSGRYEVRNNMSVGQLVNMLANGHQTPLRLVVGKSRTKAEFAEKIDKELAFSKKDLLSKLNDNEFLSTFGLDSSTSLTLFIPNTYEVYWDISVEEFFKRMNREQEVFWKKRLVKLEEIGFTKIETMTIASIVEEETNQVAEKPIIAGVYINRLKINMPLQADPTIKYALGDFTIKRIAGKMLGVDSPFNTYKRTGLPPNPICIPSISSIDAVLNYSKHNYLFFCAKEDFSGNHNFTANINEHYANARKYQKALNERDIY